VNLRVIPIRWKLTGWYALLLVLSLVVLGCTVYYGTRWQLLNDLDEELDDRSVEVEFLIRPSPTGITLDASSLIVDDDRFVRVWDQSGALIVDTSSAFGPVPAFERDVALARSGEIRRTEFEGSEELLHARFSPVRIDGDIVGVILVAQSTGDVEETLTGLIRLQLAALPLAVLLALVTGYVVAGRVLAPVVRITDLAASIDSRALNQRLALPLPDDELGRLARTFDSMLERIEDAFDQQRRFTGDAAHELRTPLGIMRSRIELALARPRSSDDYRQALDDLERDLTRLQDLTSSLLRLARLDAKGFQLEAEAFDLAATLHRVAELYQGASCDIVVRAEAVTICADQDLIIQLLVNLMDNAVRHTPAGGRVTLGCAGSAMETQLWVEDTGPGIPAQFHQQVFTRFFRLDEGRTRQGGGVGLGLSICQAIVIAHGGTISVAIVLPTGLRLDVHLPRQSGT
jgi:heavy metal sensor kinase